MQKRILFFCFLLTATSLHALKDHTSQSFMFPRPASHNLPMMQSTWHNHIYQKRGDLLGSFQVVPYYNDSVDNGNNNRETARYFYPSCNEPVAVRGDSATIVETGTYVRAEWLNLPADFYGTFTLDPHQKKYGVFFEYNQDLKKIFDADFFKHFWVSITIPYEVVKNKINVQASGSTALGVATLPTTIIEALDWDGGGSISWKYARFKNSELKKTGIGDIQFKLGATFYAKNDFEVIYYTLLSIPSGKEQNPRFIFSPFLGNNGHIAYGNGVNFQLPITRKNADFPILFYMNIEHKYLFKNKQYRTFDLRNKAWSRYLLFSQLGSSSGAPLTPGVNLLTRYVKIQPDSFVDFSTGFRIKANELEFELGYNLWAHRTERIEFLRTVCDDCYNTINLSEYGIAGTSSLYTASTSTISTRAANDTIFTTISELDLDKNSGAARSATTHKLHGSIGYGHKGINYDGFVNFGAFYEIPQNNAALQQWGIWGKAGVSL